MLALANILPEKCVEIYQLVQDGKINEARELQLRMPPVCYQRSEIYYELTWL